MRPPPPIVELPRYPIVGGTILLSIGATIFYLNDHQRLAPLMDGPEILLGEYWRLLTSILVHGDWFHLIFNAYWLWVFGTLIEDSFGHPATLAMIVLFAAGSGAAEYAVFEGGIGLSGVGYGFFTMIWVLSRIDGRFKDVIDRTTIGLFVGWFFICIFLSTTDVMPIANVAHGVGALLGAVMGVVIGWSRMRIVAAGVLLLLVAQFVAAAIWFRPWVNFQADRGDDELRLGNKLFDAGRYDEALMLYREATRLRPERPEFWHNVGAALYAQGKMQESKRALDKEIELKQGGR